MRLDWKTEVAPVISTYMARMMQANYSQNYRRDTLNRALRIYDKKVKDDMEGVGIAFREERKKTGRRMTGPPRGDM